MARDVEARWVNDRPLHQQLCGSRTLCVQRRRCTTKQKRHWRWEPRRSIAREPIHLALARLDNAFAATTHWLYGSSSSKRNAGVQARIARPR